MVITKPTAVSNRFLALLYLLDSLPNLPPHLYKCGGSQQNKNLPYFLLFHLHTEEEVGALGTTRRPSISYGNITSTVKKRNDESPEVGTSLQPSVNFALPFALILDTNDLPVPSVEWLNSNFGLPPSIQNNIN